MYVTDGEEGDESVPVPECSRVELAVLNYVKAEIVEAAEVMSGIGSIVEVMNVGK